MRWASRRAVWGASVALLLICSVLAIVFSGSVVAVARDPVSAPAAAGLVVGSAATGDPLSMHYVALPTPSTAATRAAKPAPAATSEPSRSPEPLPSPSPVPSVSAAPAPTPPAAPVPTPSSPAPAPTPPASPEPTASPAPAPTPLAHEFGVPSGFRRVPADVWVAHANPLRWQAFDDPADEYRYALGTGPLAHLQRVLDGARDTEMPEGLTRALHKAVYGGTGTNVVVVDSRVRTNEWASLERLDWMRMTPAQGTTVGAVESLRVLSLARSFWPPPMRDVGCATVLRWSSQHVWAQRWQHLCAFGATWAMSWDGTRQHDTLSVVTARSSATCTRRLPFVYSTSDGLLFDAAGAGSANYCSCELRNVEISVPRAGLPTAEFFVETVEELRRAECVGEGHTRTVGACPLE